MEIAMLSCPVEPDMLKLWRSLEKQGSMVASTWSGPHLASRDDDGYQEIAFGVANLRSYHV